MLSPVVTHPHAPTEAAPISREMTRAGTAAAASHPTFGAVLLELSEEVLAARAEEVLSARASVAAKVVVSPLEEFSAVSWFIVCRSIAPC